MADSTENDDEDIGSESAYLPFLRNLQQHKSKHADFTIKRGDRTWKVHKLVICTHSDYFSKACNGEFKEATKNMIDLGEEDDEQAISAMIHFFYHFNYPTVEKGPSTVLQHIRTLIVADKYLVAPLRELTLRNLREQLAEEWSTKSFPMAIREIYALDTIHRDMLKPELTEIAAQFPELFTDRSGDYADFQSTLRDVEDFAIDALTAVARTTPEGFRPRTYKCPGCANFFSVQHGQLQFRCPYRSTCNSPGGNTAGTMRSLPFWVPYEV